MRVDAGRFFFTGNYQFVGQQLGALAWLIVKVELWFSFIDGEGAGPWEPCPQGHVSLV